MGDWGMGAAGSCEQSRPSFFISYANEDAAYVARLAGYLHEFGLPLWFDAHLKWGSQFPQEIRDQIMHALGIIVVMSPAAEASEWVEREILEGQRYDRGFLPILLRGERLFLLASSQYFDARDGALPGAGEIRRLRRILDAHSTGSRGGPALELPAPTQWPPAPTQWPPAPTPPGPTDIPMRKIWSFLDEGQVEHADILTTSVLLEAVGRLDSGWMRLADGQRLSFGLLADIDAAWSKFSQGSQGFRAQLALHRSHPKGAAPGSQRDFSALTLSLGWKSDRSETSPTYGDFVKPVDHHAGFFPTLRNPQLEQQIPNGWHDNWRATVMAVHLQLRRWGGQR